MAQGGGRKILSLKKVAIKPYKIEQPLRPTRNVSVL